VIEVTEEVGVTETEEAEMVVVEDSEEIEDMVEAVVEEDLEGAVDMEEVEAMVVVVAAV